MILEFAETENKIFDELMKVIDQFSTVQKFNLSFHSAISLPGIEIAPERRKVYRSGVEVPLSMKEYELLYLLAEHKGIVLTYQQIYQRVWNDYAQAVENNTISYHISKMRKKVCPVPSESKFVIRCVRGVGYCLDILPESSI